MHIDRPIGRFEVLCRNPPRFRVVTETAPWPTGALFSSCCRAVPAGPPASLRSDRAEDR